MLQQLEDKDYPLDAMIVGLAQLLCSGLEVNSIDSYTLLKLKQAIEIQLELLEANIH
jgi:hypothetical protein